MKPLSKLFFALSSLLAIAIFALVVFVALFDANHYKAQISQLVKQNTGRDLHLKGDIKLSIYPNIALNLGAASLSNAQGFGNVPFATVKSARVAVKLMPLLKKKLVVEQIILEGLQLDLHKKADGRRNWDSWVSHSNSGKDQNQLSNEWLSNLSVAGMNLSNAAIQWRDETTQQNIVIAPFNLRSGVFRPNQPIDIHFDGTLKQQQPALSVTTEVSTTLTVSQNNQYMTLKGTRLKATASGLPVSSVVLSGDIQGTLKQLTIAGLKLHLVGDKSLLPKGNLQLDLAGDTQLDIEQQSINIPAMQLQTTLTDLPHPAALIKATVSGHTTMNLQQVHIAGMTLKADLQKVAANQSATQTEIKGDARFDIDKLLLTIKGMAAKAKSTRFLEDKGEANATLTGDLHANLNDMQVDISAMTLATSANNLPKIGNVDTTIAGHLKANMKQQQFALHNANIKANVKSEALSGGHLYAQLSSKNIIANSKKQHFKLQGMTLNATLNGGIVPGGKLIHRSQGNIDVDLTRYKGHAQLKNIRLEMAGATLTGSAKLTRLSPQLTLTGIFKTNPFNLKKVLTVLGVKLPPTSKANVFGNSQASFQLIATPNSAHLRQLTLRMDQSKITGEVAINNFQQPAIKTQLKIDQWVVDDYLAPVNPNVAKKRQPTDKLLPVKMMKTLNFDGSLDIKKLRFDQVDFTHVHANIKAKNGIIDAKPLRFNAYKGNYTGALNINVTNRIPVITMQHQIKKVRSENLLLQFFEDRYVSGGIYLKTNLTTRGNTLATIKKNLNGHADVEFRKGTIRDSKLAKKVSQAIELFEKRKTNAKGQQEVTFTKLGGNWVANNGLFTTDNMQLLAPNFLITGKGAVNLVKNQLDLKLRLRSKNKKSKLFAPLHIHGNFDELKYELELDVLVKSLLQSDLYKKQAQLKQKLLDEKAKRLEQLEARKQKELDKLQAKKEEAQRRLKAEQEKIQQRLQNEQLKMQQRLQDRLKHEQDKLQNQLNDKVKETLGDQANDAVDNVTEEVKKNIEEEAKDKLKDALKGLF